MLTDIVLSENNKERAVNVIFVVLKFIITRVGIIANF